METRVCSTCDKTLPIEEFAPQVRHRPLTHNVRCKECKKEAIRRTVSVNHDDGYIYVIVNPAWPNWCKIGLTKKSPEERLRTYQTGSPLRDYEIYFSLKVDNVVEVEKEIHQYIETTGITKSNEWFYIDKVAAVHFITEVISD